MEDGNSKEGNFDNLFRCPHCSCCFCNEVDLKHHIKVYGDSQTKHSEEFRRTHGRLEHGFGGSE
jgi:hypothetical protein